MAKYLHGAYSFLNVPSTGGGSGPMDHARLINRDAEDQHPIASVTGLSEELRRLEIMYSKRLEGFDELRSLLPFSMDNAKWQDALIGAEIPDVWTDESGTEYGDPMIVVALENIEDENGETHWGAYVQRKYEALRSVQFDAAETEYPNGYNNYVQSGIRQYLNSSAGIGEWWTATHEGDIAPTQLATLRGYMAGCSAALLAAAKPCRVSCMPAGGDAETVTDTFWLPSARQMYGVGNDGEGVFWPYWKRATGLDSPGDGANSGRIVYQISSHTTAQTCRLRSAYYNNAKSTWIVSNAGAISTGDASNSYYFTPCCAIW